MPYLKLRKMHSLMGMIFSPESGNQSEREHFKQEAR